MKRMAPPQVDLAHDLCALLVEGGMPMLSAMSLQNKLRAGKLRAVAARSRDGLATVIVDERAGWRQVVAGHGPESALLEGLAELRGTSDGLFWDEGALKIDGAKLEAAGHRLVERQVFTQALARVPVPGPVASGYEVLPLAGAVVAEARRLFAKTHAMNVEGLYTTLPEAPTLARCEAAFDGYIAGAHGMPVASASVVVRSQDRTVGVICCAATEIEGTAALLGLAVDPSERGRGLSRVLVRCAQHGLKTSGFERMLFLTTDRNAPVHRLFTPEEIVATETFLARLWFRETSQEASGG